MSNKNRSPSIDSKTIRFDEENLLRTNHPMEKDYGLMSIPESKTPFPRHANPVEAKELQRRLQEVLERANNDLLSVANVDGDGARSAYDEEFREKQHAEFLRKRKQFYQSEFLIAKQKMMRMEMHPPGPSVGNNWRIDDTSHGRDHASSGHTGSMMGGRYTSSISQHHLPALLGSHLNQETLREIAKGNESI